MRFDRKKAAYAVSREQTRGGNVSKWGNLDSGEGKGQVWRLHIGPFAKRSVHFWCRTRPDTVQDMELKRSAEVGLSRVKN